MRVAVVIATCIAGLLPTVAQSEDGPSLHVSSAAPPSARYEILQSLLAVRWTFRLDRYCGAVWQLVSTERDGLVWEKMPVENASPCTQASRPHFQIFLSSMAVRHSYMIDTDTGRTWQLASDKDNNHVWQVLGPAR